MTIAEASKIAERVVSGWLVDSSLKHFEMWSGADCIELSLRLQVTYARFHNIHHNKSTRHRYSFGRDENTDTWTLFPSTVPMRSAVSEFREHVCTDGCWICISMEEDEDAETVSQWLIKEKLISTVPWDDACACLRFSVTFAAKDLADEKRVLGEIAARLGGVEFEF